MPREDPTPDTDQITVSRRPIDPGAVQLNGMWCPIETIERTGSTNADLLARPGAAEGLVLVAEEQTAGRGRMGRTWITPPHAALTFSMLLRPSWVPTGKLGWLSLLTGISVA